MSKFTVTNMKMDGQHDWVTGEQKISGAQSGLCYDREGKKNFVIWERSIP